MASLTVRAPYNDVVLGEVPLNRLEQIESALARAAAHFADRRQWLSPAQRIDVLRRAADLLGQRAEDTARAAAQEGGKPLVDSRVEVARAIDGLRSCVESLRTQAGRGVPMELNVASSERLAFSSFEPVGPVLAISAFNHPLNNLIHQVGPALAAGCPVMVKPAPATPLTALRFVALLHEAGLPEGVCQLLLPEDNAQIQKLAADPRLGFVSFIGSSEVGWSLRSRLAPGVRASLELGGAAPVVVDRDADLEDLIPRLAKGGYYHAGQVCVSVQRVFAHVSLARTLAEKLAQAVSKLRVGDPTSAETEVGPLIREASVQKVGAWVDEAVSQGAELLTGGKPLSKSCYAPTLLWNPPVHAKVSTQEIFGPVVSVYPVASLEEGVQRANEVPFAFQSAVFTRSLDAALYAQRHLRAATVLVNDHTAFRVDWMPFGGLSISGLGMGGIPYSLREMQVEKLCIIRSGGLSRAP
jgi:acyl-CoA reductase-like NAD-dependent aldehyde dehydrogenase